VFIFGTKIAGKIMNEIWEGNNEKMNYNLNTNFLAKKQFFGGANNPRGDSFSFYLVLNKIQILAKLPPGKYDLDGFVDLMRREENWLKLAYFPH
jgi:hypothetical protein